MEYKKQTESNINIVITIEIRKKRAKQECEQQT